MSDLPGIQFTKPWHPVEESHVEQIIAELQRELSADHLLFGQSLWPVARRQDCDDFLFRVGHSPERYAVVHLTWTGKRESSSRWPTTAFFDSLDHFVEQMRLDSIEFEN
jgi:hypothetical protein